MSFIDVEEEDGIAYLTLNRPDAKNALSRQLTAELDGKLEALENDANVRVLVLRGAGGNFAAGADIAEMTDLAAAEVVATDFAGCSVLLPDVTKPVLAAVEGYALGGGCELVEMCDIVIASRTAKFGHPEVKLGTMSGAGGTQRISRMVGKAVAMDLLLTGRTISAEEAKEIGLVSRVVAPEALQAEVAATARALAQLSPPVLKLIKQAVLAGSQQALHEGLTLERRSFQLTFALDDRREGMQAFLERRPPTFRGL